MSTSAARKLRLHPAPQEDFQPLPPVRPTRRRIKNLFWPILIGILVASAVKYFCFSTRFYQAQAHITINSVEPDVIKHLSALSMIDLPTQNQTSTRELTQQGKLTFYAAAPNTLAFLVTASNEDLARELASQIAADYIASIEVSPEDQLLAEERRQAILDEFEQLQDRRRQMDDELATITEGLSLDQIDQSLNRATLAIRARLNEIDSSFDQLQAGHADIAAMRAELASPILKLDPDQWNQIKSADRLYTGDFSLLTVRHSQYREALAAEMKNFSDSLDQLQHQLSLIGQGVSTHLRLPLPDDLSDDLLEMNLAVRNYQDQLERFNERRQRYQDRLADFLNDPARTDFDTIGTLLSQVRQDLLQRYGGFQEHLQKLFDQLRQPADQTRSHSNLTARQVAASTIAHPVDQAQRAWQKATFHLNRLFTDANPELMTLTRTARSLQARLRYRETHLRHVSEQQLLARQRRQIQNRLFELYDSFDQSTHRLVALYRQFPDDQDRLIDLAQRWPKIKTLQDTIQSAEKHILELQTALADQTSPADPESLELSTLTVRSLNLAGLSPNAETAWSLLFGLLAAVLAIRRRAGSDSIPQQEKLRV